MPEQLLYFNAQDRDKLGEIAETYRGFIHTKPCLRGDFDAVQALVKSLTPALDPDFTEPEEPIAVQDYRRDVR